MNRKPGKPMAIVRKAQTVELANVPQKPITDATPNELIAQAIARGMSVDSLERLMAMRREVLAEQAKHEFTTAMSAFQSECPEIKKTKAVYNSESKGGGLRYKFAPLDLVVKAVRPLLVKHGLSYTIKTVQEPASVRAICVVRHIGGWEESTEFMVPVDPEAYMNAQQKIASAMTYAKRYAFENGFGIMTGSEDDDAVMAGGAEFYSEVEQPKAVGPAQPKRTAMPVDMEALYDEVKALIAEKTSGKPQEAFTASAQKAMRAGLSSQLLAIKETLTKMRTGGMK